VVGAGEPSLRSALESAVELARARDQIAAGGHLSLGLLDGHLAQTAARIRTLDLAAAIPDRDARRGGLLLVLAVAVHLAAGAALRGPLLLAYARVLRGDPPGSPLQMEPVTGDVELSYQYPAYMRREPRTLSGTGGEVRAPRGTLVTLRTRADRKVVAAELLLDAAAPPAQPAAAKAPPPAAGRRLALAVKDGRDLSGGFQVMESGSYRFLFKDQKGRLLVEGPPIPVTIEPDAYPTVRITAPEREVEVDPGATVQISWEAEDDVGLGEVALLLKPPQGDGQRLLLRGDDPVRRDAGTYSLSLAPLHLAEGERLTYRVEAQDGDTVSGPKAASSETQVIKIYSEAEHRRAALERARAVFEEAIAVLGDRLDLRGQGPANTEEALPRAQALDLRTRVLTDHLRGAARDLRKDRAGPREVAQALDNVAQSVGFALEGAIASRARLAMAARIAVASPDEGRRQRAVEEGQAAAVLVERDDAAVEGALEKGILYLEQLLDKRRAEDLLALAKNLAAKRRDLASLLEQYRKAPSEKAKEELVAQVQRMKDQVRDLLSRMAELSKGFNDEHMNEEALAELSRSQDLLGGLDEVEKKLSGGDVEGAMKALDQMASAMDRMMAGLSRTAGQPDERTRALLEEMLAFKRQLEKLEGEQRQAADETEKIRAEYRRKVAERLLEAEAALKKLQELAQGALRDLEAARPGVSYRGESDYEGASEAVSELSRALAMRELDGAADAAHRATQPLERLNQTMEEDAAAPRSPLSDRPRPQVELAQRRVGQAVPKVREIRDQLSRLFPDPRSVLSKEEQARMGELSRRQGDLEQEVAQLQEALAQLSRKAPLFPPSAQGQLGESRGHMGEAAAELGNRNPQRGHGQQELALDALARFRKGLEDAAKSMQQGGGQGGEGFPFPFADNGPEGREGDGGDPSREKVKIPGAEAHKVPEAFRKDLLEAMKQGTPERYRADVQRYYEELVK
jgi:Asp-tRNA(Asn)/Glu-tRNA(Gln) amidotransferase C subunit